MAPEWCDLTLTCAGFLVPHWHAFAPWEPYKHVVMDCTPALQFGDEKVLTRYAFTLAPAPIRIHGLCNVVWTPPIHQTVCKGYKPCLRGSMARFWEVVEVSRRPDIGFQPFDPFFGLTLLTEVDCF